VTLVEGLDVSLTELGGKRLLGPHVDLLKPGSQTDGRGVDIQGWALGRSSSVVAFGVGRESFVVQHFTLNVRQPHVVAAHSEVPGAENTGFRTTVRVPG
jgi:hypothetical protein